MKSAFYSQQLNARAQHAGVERQCYCGKYNGYLGREGLPSSKWFDNQEQVDNIRNKARRICNKINRISSSLPQQIQTIQHGIKEDHYATKNTINDMSSVSKSGGKRGHIRVLTVYERDSTRHFLDLDTFIKSLQHIINPSWTIRLVTHDENMEPCKLQAAIHDTDFFLTTHGFQSTAIILLPQGATIVEIFPYKYFKPS